MIALSDWSFITAPAWVVQYKLVESTAMPMG
jgi:hypothetical protein